jgi:4'-phosphopantetheinyl transferase
MPPSAAPDPLGLWWAPLDVAPRLGAALEAVLSSGERERARRFRHDRDRARFVAGRGWLRHVLAGQLGCAPAAVAIVADDPAAKPRLAGGELRFNAARSDDVAVFVTSATREVGIDVEAVRGDVDVDRLLARFGAPAERRALAALAPEARRDAWFRLWARKEAYVKGVGLGLAVPLATVDVWSAADRAATVAEWSIHDLEVAPGFAAAVAAADLGGWAPKAVRRASVPG